MPIDTNLILQAGKMPDFGETMQRSLTLSQLARQNRKANQEDSENEAVKKAFESGIVQNPDGSTSLDRKTTLSALYKASPMKAMEAERNFKAQDIEAQNLQFQNLSKQAEAAKQLAWSINDPATYEAARQKGLQLGLPNADKLPPQYPGDDYIRHMQMTTLNATEQLAQQNKEREFRQKDRELGIKDKGEKSKQLPPDKVLLVNEGNTIPTMLKDISATIENNSDAFGPIIGRARSANPYDAKAQAIQSQIKASSQAFGRYMEGGVLRKEDEIKYERMFPQQSDDPATAKNKLAIVNKLLIDKQKSNLQALKKSGYDISGVDSGALGEGKTPDILNASSRGSGGGLNEANAAGAPKVFKTSEIEW